MQSYIKILCKTIGKRKVVIYHTAYMDGKPSLVSQEYHIQPYQFN